MKISVITATYNSKKTIIDNIESVQKQNYNNVEHIIIDGKSTDGTIKILEFYKSSLKYVSEHDQGCYDAFNKGINLASGDIIAILNSDDVFFDHEVLSKVEKVFTQTDADIVYGNAVIVKKDNLYSVIRYWKSSKFLPNSFIKNSWHPPHTSFFVRKSIYEEYGKYDASLTIAADFELMLRFMEVNNLKSEYLDLYLTRMRVGGKSQKIKNIIKGFFEIKKSFKINGIDINLLKYFAKRYYLKINQFFI